MLSEVGVIVLAGSSGRVDTPRALILAASGVTALALRWWGGPGRQPSISEVPIETITSAVDDLLDMGVGRVSLLGTSKGAEAALLAACFDPRIHSVIAVSPSSVVWEGLGGRPPRSSWTWRGRPLPFVPYDETWQPGPEPVSYASLYLRSLESAAPEAAIPVERAAADLLLIGGGADALWPSCRFIDDLSRRRREAGRPVSVMTHPSAGHRVLFPGEDPPPPSRLLHGGTPEADRALGAMAWPHVLQALAW
ncbi:hypothetical protein J4573_35885 [Actinomadura barringtoniae]|uniref:BAAT/Acyl-CoA thioester hydrolase C-terminal domain-containing protein n=1 Tax=Actinomadura barringtoniae TaxID=1427535 RepID=A0A939PMB5_9ACTN|nr:acyl-CoA thioester hydrolase/BAAT C-terminal domain-containing protein [Actinomadura barringtoniae]MBO2452519.1 hypothetical protein [Actinomadura barringtoniae]